MELSLDVTFMKTLQGEFEEKLKSYMGNELHVERMIPLSGGDINEVFKLETNKVNFCIKLNDAVLYPEMFEKEARGLNELRKSSFRVPEVISTGSYNEYAFLILEFIDARPPKDNFWKQFAENLANLHSIHNDSFGWEEDNYIGTLVQTNRSNYSWSQFLYKERLSPMVKKALDKGLMNSQDLFYLEKIHGLTEELYGTSKASLIHGDLWSGNYMSDENGAPVLIDPAVYYGHPDMDIAMTRLFGGFDDKLYSLYSEIVKQDKDWDVRTKICKLYPLLVHVNLFGGYYVQQYRDLVQRLI
jgi:fructosamine-3-kinase